jgi:Kef-type K+ transport system membrane component KefB
MEWLDAFRSHALTLPNLAKFAIVLALVVGVSALARRLRIPELVGLLVVGVLLGPHVLGLYDVNYPIVQFFADLGRLMLMFAAGLEIDINLFRKTQTQSVTFGLVTTIVPQLLGTAFGLAFGCTWFRPFSSPFVSLNPDAGSTLSRLSLGISRRTSGAACGHPPRGQAPYVAQ